MGADAWKKKSTQLQKSVLIMYLFERNSLPLKYTSYLDLILHLFTHLQVLEYITLLQLFNVHLFKATGHNRSQATMSKLLVWSLMLQLAQGDA